MACIIKPVTQQKTPPASDPLLQQIKKELGTQYNIFTTVAHSPPALESLWSQIRTLSQMKLSAKVRTAIALRVSQLNGCEYGVAANTAWGESAGVDAGCALNFRRGISLTPKEQALLNLATKLVKDRGHHAGFEVEAARRSGATNAELIEVVQMVSLQSFMNYLTSLAGVELDFPRVELWLPEKMSNGSEHSGKLER